MDPSQQAATCSDFGDAMWRLVFDAYLASERCNDVKGVYAFATLAACSFAAFVVVDLIVYTVARSGMTATGAGNLAIKWEGSGWALALKLFPIILFGMVAAWIVALFAAIVEFLQLAPQTAIAAGVLWQVTYAQLLARLGKEVKDPPAPAPATAVVPSPTGIQAPTEEVEE